MVLDTIVSAACLTDLQTGSSPKLTVSGYGLSFTLTFNSTAPTNEVMIAATDSTQTSAQIPTAAGETTISWAGDGLAPSQFDSIQEWVDAQTYTRVNGEWVADN